VSGGVGWHLASGSLDRMGAPQGHTTPRLLEPRTFRPPPRAHGKGSILKYLRRSLPATPNPHSHPNHRERGSWSYSICDLSLMCNVLFNHKLNARSEKDLIWGEARFPGVAWQPARVHWSFGRGGELAVLGIGFAHWRGTRADTTSHSMPGAPPSQSPGERSVSPRRACKSEGGALRSCRVPSLRDHL
jgi:hypothetical protein